MKKVITFGTFDLFHEGHYNLLKNAKALGDYLVVGVTTQNFDTGRGKLNVIDSLAKRMENVKESGFADEIIVEEYIGQKIEEIQKNDIDIFAIGSDWLGAFDHLKDYCEVVYLPRTKGISSTSIRNSAEKIIQLGVIGSGGIAKRFFSDSKAVSGVSIEIVYNPHIESAERFKERFEMAAATDDLDRFLSSVQAVYIASPSDTHVDYARICLERGKHVLCEKPMAFSGDDARELFDLAKRNAVVLMEAVKTAYAPGFIQLTNVARSGVIGRIRGIEANFTKLNEPMKYSSMEGLASYPLLAIFRLLGWNYLDSSFTSFMDDDGMDRYTRMDFIYPHAMATGKVGNGVKTEGQLVVSGTRGYILAPAPWWLTKHFSVHYEDANSNEIYFSHFLGEGLRYELEDFVKAIANGKNASFKLSAEESIAMAEIQGKFLRRENTRVLFYE